MTEKITQRILEEAREKAQAIRAERGPRGKDADPCIAAQPGRPHGCRPVLTQGRGKLPDQPQMAIFPDSPQGLGLSKFPREHNLARQGRHNAALAGNAEFRGKRRPDPRNGTKDDRVFPRRFVRAAAGPARPRFLFR